MLSFNFIFHIIRDKNIQLNLTFFPCHSMSSFSNPSAKRSPEISSITLLNSHGNLVWFLKSIKSSTPKSGEIVVKWFKKLVNGNIQKGGHSNAVDVEKFTENWKLVMMWIILWFKHEIISQDLKRIMVLKSIQIEIRSFERGCSAVLFRLKKATSCAVQWTVYKKATK